MAMMILGSEKAREEGAIGELVFISVHEFVVDDRGDLLEVQIPEQLFDLVGHDSGSPASSARMK